MPSDLRTILLDIEKETNGILLKDEFEIRGKKYLIKLFNDKEAMWTVSFMKPDNQITMLMASRVSQLAIAIRSIDGYSIADIFASELRPVIINEADVDKESKEKHNEKIRILSYKYENDKQLMAADLFLHFLLHQAPIFIDELYNCLEILGKRQREAQEELKKLVKGKFGSGREKELEELNRTFPIWKKIEEKIRVKSEVLSRKKILISDPNVKNMTDFQWMFELEGLLTMRDNDAKKLIDIFDLVKKGIINVLGLNLMPIPEELSEEEKAAFAKVGANPEDSYRLRSMKDDEFLPFVIMAGHPEMVSELLKKRMELFQQDQIDASVEDLPIEDLEKSFSEVNKKRIEQKEIDQKKIEEDSDIPEFFDEKDFGKYARAMHVSKEPNKGVVESIEDLEKDEDIFVKSNRLERLANSSKKAKISLEY